MYQKGSAYDTTCSQPGTSAIGAIWPAKTNDARWNSVFAVRMRVAQNASDAMTQLNMKSSAAASSTLGTNATMCHSSV